MHKTRSFTFRIYNLEGEVKKKKNTTSNNMRESASYKTGRGKQDTGEI